MDHRQDQEWIKKDEDMEQKLDKNKPCHKLRWHKVDFLGFVKQNMGVMSGVVVQAPPS